MQTMEQQNDKISFFKGMRDGVPSRLGTLLLLLRLALLPERQG